MLKTIPTNQVRLGMHIHALKGAWIDHPFWKTKFVINDPKDLEKLRSSVIKMVEIDVAKGFDTLDENIESTKSNELQLVIKDTEKKEAKVNLEKLSAQQERQQAARIIKQSKEAVVSMFSDMRLGKAVSTEAVTLLVKEISASVSRNRGALISLARLKTQDDYTYMHCVAVCALMTALAKELGLSELETKQAGLAGLLHDTGKALVPLDVLNKPAALTDDEFALIKRHPESGHALLIKSGIKDEITLDVCLHHHEKVDGSGYPHQLKDAEISLFAKMGAICDVYDAVTSNRPYKTGWEPGASIKKMSQWEGHFDQRVFKAFVKSIGIYPIGSVVILKSGRLAVVVDQSSKSLLTPSVKVFFSTRFKSRIPIELLDLSKDRTQDEILGHESAANWGITDVHELWSE